ncbi:PIG-L deacetylase family protein [Pelagibius sp.]|uniref:PIG-L deacetylase family protein n=1 Tax=Pelagibius sp. TaxID=1931238 RepID=UPI003B513DB7
MTCILIIAPHPDDETLGCGGTLLRHRDHGDEVHWLVATAMTPEAGYSDEQIKKRSAEMEKVRDHFGFAELHDLSFPPAGTDQVPMKDMVQALASVIDSVSPTTVYVPYGGDVHSDHQMLFRAATSALKSFRAPTVNQILAYETISETDFNSDPREPGFCPNWYVDITSYLPGKLLAMAIYDGEMAEFPFPRSPEAITALAHLRGSQCGCYAAEGFVLLRSIAR